MAVFTDYLDFLQELTAPLEQLTAVEQQKIDAVRAGDLDGLNGCMKQEQVLSMTLRGLEKKRATLAAQLGLPAGPLRDLPRSAPPELAGRTADAVEAVLSRYQVLDSARQTARTLTEARLRRTEQALRRRGGLEEDVPVPPSPGGRTDIKV